MLAFHFEMQAFFYALHLALYFFIRLFSGMEYLLLYPMSLFPDVLQWEYIDIYICPANVHHCRSADNL